MNVYKLLERHDGMRKGKVLYEYPKCTYGVISKDGIAVTLEPSREPYLKSPFFEVPKNLLKFVGTCVVDENTKGSK
jgi:hypothetical protein